MRSGRPRQPKCWLMVRRFGLAALLLGGVLGCSLGSETAAPVEDDPAAPLVRTVDRGPIKLTATVAKGEISIAERVTLVVAVEAEPGIEVQMPTFGEALNEFAIRDFQEAPVATNDAGRRVYTQTYDLDIFLSGDYAIPGLTVRYRDRRGESPDDAAAPALATAPDDEVPADHGPMVELSTEPMTVHVKSLLEGEFDPQAFRDVKAPVTLPVDRDWRAWVPFIAALVGGVTLVAALVLLWRRRRIVAERVIPPYDWAMDQLRALADAQLIEAGRVTEFYYRLSEIARRYIELRFMLMAPERTTEEFLEEMRTSDVLPIEYQSPLMEFLEACDLVKYARHQPTAEEIEAVFNTARDFVERTRPEAQPAMEAAA